jgi:hypothetical protein
LDFVGPRVCNICCLAFVAVGVSLLGLSSESFQAYFPALVMIAVGGPGIQTSAFFAMNLFPSRANSVSSLISGVFQLGFAVFLGMKFIVESTSLTFKAICFIYAGALLFMALASIFLYPSTQLAPQVLVVDAEDILNDEEQQNLIDGSVQSPQGEQSLSVAPTGPFLMKEVSTWNGQLFSIPFALVAMWMTINVFWANTYIGTVGSQIKFINSNADVPSYVSVFNLVLPAGVLIIPFYGRFLDLIGYPAGFAVASVASLVFAVLYCVQSLPVQYVAFVFYALSRTCVFAAFFSYVAYEFGYKYFGTVTGGAFLTMSIFSLLQYPMTKAITNFEVLGFMQLACIAVCSTYSIYLQLRLKSPLPWEKQSKDCTLSEGTDVKKQRAAPKKSFDNAVSDHGSASEVIGA